MATETIVYMGTKFRRYPESKRWSDRAYFKATPRRLLHVEVYRNEIGPIPEGFEVHHRDFDTRNNLPSNLELLTTDAHTALHRQRLREFAIARNQIAIAQAAAKEWHRSEAGREWHRKHAAATWATRGAITYTCEECRKEFTSRKLHNVRFCHQNCRARAHRRRERLAREQHNRTEPMIVEECRIS